MFHKKPTKHETKHEKAETVAAKHAAKPMAPLTVPAHSAVEVKVNLEPPKPVVAVPPKVVKADSRAVDLLTRIHTELGAFLKGGSAGATAQHLAEDIKAYLDGLNRV
jgi:hypothetical protein